PSRAPCAPRRSIVHRGTSDRPSETQGGRGGHSCQSPGKSVEYAGQVRTFVWSRRIASGIIRHPVPSTRRTFRPPPRAERPGRGWLQVIERCLLLLQADVVAIAPSGGVLRFTLEPLFVFLRVTRPPRAVAAIDVPGSKNRWIA